MAPFFWWCGSVELLHLTATFALERHDPCVGDPDGMSYKHDVLCMGVPQHDWSRTGHLWWKRQPLQRDRQGQHIPT